MENICFEKNIYPICLFVFVEGDGKMNLKFEVILLALLFVGMAFCCFTPKVQASNTEIYVKYDYVGDSNGSANRPYNTIQEAIDVANDGDTIYIFGGLYEENLEIDKKVKIWGGVDEKETIIDSIYDNRYLIEITADEVAIEGITVRDSGEDMTSPIGALIALKSSNNQINRNNINNSNTFGIYIDPKSSDNLVSGNKINNTKTGIWIDSSNTNDIANNDIRNSTDYGILVDSTSENNRLYGNLIDNSQRSGMRIEDCDNVNITNNTIQNSDFYGIFISGSINADINNNNFKENPGDGLYLSCSHGTIKNNIFRNNKRGITLQGNNNLINNNSFIDSTASGIYSGAGSIGNTITLNRFKNNSVSAKEYGENDWYQNNKGNYWSDYNNIDVEPDGNPDGIGDRPYSKNGVYDVFPLGYFLKPPKRPSNPSPEDTETDVSLDITLKIHVEDDDSEELTVYFYRADTDTLISSQSLNPVKHVQSDSNVECRFTLGFDTTFAWYVIADDGILTNQSDPFLFFTTNTPPDNDPPVADAGGPYEGEADEPVQFDASACTDPDGTIDFYRWNFGDGTSEILQKNPTHTYEREGSYEVTLTIIDDNGSSATDITTIAVGPTTNLPPTAVISSSKTGYVDESVTFDGSGSLDPDGDDLDYTWFIQAENNTFNTENINYVFNSTGKYIITLTVNDGRLTNTTATIIEIINKPSDESPGFDIIILFVASLLVTTILLKRKNKKR